MEVAEEHIEITKTARYFTLGEPGPNKHLLIALHGYGYLASKFAAKFNQVDLSKYYIVCPEGMNRFYLSGYNGKIGAAWMTKEDRLNDIEDYVNYLDLLLSKLLLKNNFETITLLGFSQGGATASRWLALGNHSFDKFILWATVFPPDMPPTYNVKFNSSVNYFVYGNKDEFYNEEKIDIHTEELNRLNIPFELIKFEGNHNIDSDTLLKLL
jgi:predicted esterase